MEMKHLAIRWPHLHLPTEAQARWIYVAIVAAIFLAALIALGWFAAVGGFGEWSLFEE